MDSVTLVFVRGTSFRDRLIKHRNRSIWSHVGIVIGSEVFESVYPHGVVKTNILDFIKKYKEENIEFCQTVANTNWQQRANMYIGHPYSLYDELHLYRFNKRCWARPGKWSSSNYVGFILGFLRTDKIENISIQQLWIISR